MRPYVQQASQAVERAVDRFNRQTEIEDTDILVNATADAVWAITRVSFYPIHAGPVGMALPRPMERSILDQFVVLLLAEPFEGREQDPIVLVRAIHDDEQPRDFLERLLDTDETADVVRRVARWLGSCPQTCTYFRSDKPLGYCPPHSYVTISPRERSATRYCTFWRDRTQPDETPADDS